MSKSLDRLTLLDTFVRIAESGSISAAARDLGLSQPSASRQLAELESRFQAQLMTRTTHTLSLTAAGSELLADARRLLDSWEAIEERYIASKTGIRGSLKVVAPIALGQLQLGDIVLQFQQQHPLLSLSWYLEDNNIRFAETGCDCWIKIGSIPDSRLNIEPLGQVKRIVVATPSLLKAHGQLKTPAALQKLPWVALEPFEGGLIPLTNRTGKRVTLSPVVRMETNNIFALRQATLAGLGVAVMPRWFVEEALKSKNLVHVLPTWQAPQLTIHAASQPGRYRPQRLSAFLETIKREVPKIPGIVGL